MSSGGICVCAGGMWGGGGGLDSDGSGYLCCG